VRLADGDDGTTSVEYDADAVIGGAIGGVGQRVLVGVAKRNATAFFSAVDQYLTGDLAAAEATTGDVAGDAAGARDTVDAADTAPIAPGGRQVFHRPEPAPVQRSSPVELLLAALVGAAIALLGVLVGRRSAR
jgi:hypothetical protein